MPWSRATRSSGDDPLSPPSRYDLVLAVIPVAFSLGAVLSGLLSVPLRSTLWAAGIVGGLAVLDALFLNPPRGPGSARTNA